MEEQKSERVKEVEGPVVIASKVKPKRRIIEMKTWDDIIHIKNPDGVDFITLFCEQLTVYASFISSTTICAGKANIKKIEDSSDDNYIYVTYNGQDFHR